MATYPLLAPAAHSTSSQSTSRTSRRAGTSFRRSSRQVPFNFINNLAPGRRVAIDILASLAEYRLSAELNIRTLTIPNLQVRALPTVVAFRGGKQVDKFVGALDKKGVHQFLDKL